MTFANMSKPLKSKKTDKIMVDSEVLFRRLLAVSKQRDVSLEQVLTHELAPVPPSLFNDDGTMRKTSKAELAKKLESNCEEYQILPDSELHDTAYIIDGIALLQALDETRFETFDDLALSVLRKTQTLLNGNMGVISVTLIFDIYYCASIKQMERQRRVGDETTPNYVINGSRKVPNYRKFMKNTTNKAALVEFLCIFITLRAPHLLLEHQSITLAGGFQDGQIVKVVKKTGITDIPELFSTQEEDDTRILLHAINLSQSYSRIIIQCDDTDVLVLLIYYCSNGMLNSSKVYMNAGHCSKETNRQRFMPINDITDTIGKDVSLCLPASHALSGCDSTSSLFKIGKRSAYSKLLQNIEDLLPLSQFGQSSDISSILPVSTKYALMLYGSKSKSCHSLDQLRYVYACTSDKPASLFPPTDDAFEQHVRRDNYQVAIWLHSHVAKPILWKPDGNGWQLTENNLEPIMFKKEAAPKQVRDLTHLYCTDANCTQNRSCHCLSSGLSCTDLCSCSVGDCPNTDTYVVFSDDSDEDND